MILIIFISSFEINKVNTFPAITAPFPLIFLSNLFIALLTIPDKLSLDKGIAGAVITFLPPKVPNQEPKIHRIKLF